MTIISPVCTLEIVITPSPTVAACAPVAILPHAFVMQEPVLSVQQNFLLDCRIVFDLYIH